MSQLTTTFSFPHTGLRMQQRPCSPRSTLNKLGFSRLSSFELRGSCTSVSFALMFGASPHRDSSSNKVCFLPLLSSSRPGSRSHACARSRLCDTLRGLQKNGTGLDTGARQHGSRRSTAWVPSPDHLGLVPRPLGPAASTTNWIWRRPTTWVTSPDHIGLAARPLGSRRATAWVCCCPTLCKNWHNPKLKLHISARRKNLKKVRTPNCSKL